MVHAHMCLLPFGEMKLPLIWGGNVLGDTIEGAARALRVVWCVMSAWCIQIVVTLNVASKWKVGT